MKHGQTTYGEQLKLLYAIRSSPGLRALGCEARRALSGAVIVSVNGQTIGLWWREGQHLCFGTSPYRPAAYRVRTAEEALSKTVSLACGV